MKRLLLRRMYEDLSCEEAMEEDPQEGPINMLLDESENTQAMQSDSELTDIAIPTASSDSPSNFRLNCLSLFATYSQCPLPKDHVLACLQSLVNIREYIVAEELHKDGESHIHVYLRLCKRINTVNCRYFDLEGLEETNGRKPIYHPNLGSARSPKNVIRYCTKDGNYLTNFHFEIGDPWKDALNLAREGKVEEACNLLATKKTRDWLMAQERILSALQWEAREKTAETHDHFLTLEEDYWPIPSWNRRKTLIIYGRAGMGKTELAKHLLPRGFVVSDLDDLKEFDAKKHDGVIFDDCPISRLSPEEQIHLIDTDIRRTFKNRYKNAVFPKGTPRIFTTYHQSGPSWVMKVWDEAIKRRICAWQILPDPDGLELHHPETAPHAKGRRELVEVDPDPPTARVHGYTTHSSQ